MLASNANQIGTIIMKRAAIGLAALLVTVLVVMLVRTLMVGAGSGADVAAAPPIAVDAK